MRSRLSYSGVLSTILLVALLSVSARSVAQSQQMYGLVHLAAASLRAQPSNASELETQASYGTPLTIIDRQGEWLKVVMPDGYEAFINNSAVTELDSVQMSAWRKSARLFVHNPFPLRAVTDTLSYQVAFDVVIGSIFSGSLKPGARYAEVVTPDGRRGYLPSAAVADFSQWAQLTSNVNRMFTVAHTLMGTAYLWGGTTPYGIDCSGLTRLCYFDSGLMLPRNASAQAGVGMELSVDDVSGWLPGDLLFFGNGSGDGRITHVGLYLGEGRFIHASGRVFISSVLADDELYLPRKVIKVTRPLTAADKLSLRKHEAYF